ncbi:MAG: hypothetical protein ACUVV0_16605 [Anaerolineae bacterium]
MVKVTFSEWLDYWKFNPYPFASTEAEGEAIYWPERLAERLVKPRCFDRVLGQASDPKTVVVFAPRGAGKTACRILVDYYCQQGIGQGDRPASETGGRVLPVPHTRLDVVIQLAGGEIARVNEHLHVVEILRRAVKSLSGLLMKNEELVNRIRALSKWERFDLEWFFHVYPVYLFAEELAFMREEVGFFKGVRIVEQSGRLGFLKEQIGPGEDEFPKAVLDLWEARLQTPVIDQLQSFIKLVGEIGFQAVYVLVDGLDELEQTADDPSSGMALLAPLIANLKLMNTTPGLAFKFFLPAEMQPFIQISPKIRRDRLAFETVVWSEDDLLEILHRRLAVCSDFIIKSLDAISAPELRDRVERELVREAQGNPRRLIRLADLLVQIHCERDFAPGSSSQEMIYLLNEKDLEDLLARLPQEQAMKPSYEAPPLPPILVETERPDKNQLVETICQDFPAPIALVYLDYLRRQEPLEKFQRLLDLFEVTVCFIGILLLSQLRALAGDQTPAKLRSAVLNLQGTSLGLWLVVWERLPGLCASLGKGLYTSKLQSLYARQRERLAAFRDLRNSFAHGALRDEQSYMRELERYDPEIHALLSDLRFLSGVQMVKVKTMKKQQERFIHRARLYKGDNTNFPWVDILLDFPLECDKVLVFQDSYSFVLSLHPFVVVESCPDCGGDEEIFFYQKFNADALIYLSFYKDHRLLTSEYIDEFQQIIGG